MNIDLSIAQLRVILAVAQVHSFSRASKELHVAQSSISRTVAQVERQLGVRLFERTTRQVAPTTYGTEFVRTARSIVEAFDSGLRHFSGFLDGTRGLVRIATLPSLAATLLPAIIERFRVDHPDVRIELEDMLSAQVHDSVEGGQVDLAITAGDDVGSMMEVRALVRDTFFAVTPADHRFAHRGSVSWTEIAAESFVAFDESSSVRRLVDGVFAGGGIEPASQVTARNIASVAGLCSAGLGITAAPGLVLPLMAFAGLTAVPLADPPLVREVSVVTDPRRPMTPAARDFITVLDTLATARSPLPDGVSWVV